MTDQCPFCERIATGHYDMAVESSIGGEPVFVFAPLDPVTPGHTLFVPWGHHTDASRATKVAAAVMEVAAQHVHDLEIEANIITSIGPSATQTVYHMHVHVVPRTEGDGLALPWTNQKVEAG